MSDIEFVDEPRPGNEKYPAKLEAIKEMQLREPTKREAWAWLNGFKSEGTARDLAHRLRGVHPDFDFIARAVDRFPGLCQARGRLERNSGNHILAG